MATGAASQPAGKVTEVFSDAASREGAFRFLESKEIGERVLQRAVRKATLDRCGRSGDRVVIVPIDATTISLTERTAQKGFGQVGVWSAHGRGLHVMSALALTKSARSDLRAALVDPRCAADEAPRAAPLC